MWSESTPERWRSKPSTKNDHRSPYYLKCSSIISRFSHPLTCLRFSRANSTPFSFFARRSLTHQVLQHCFWCLFGKFLLFFSSNRSIWTPFVVLGDSVGCVAFLHRFFSGKKSNWIYKQSIFSLSNAMLLTSSLILLLLQPLIQRLFQLLAQPQLWMGWVSSMRGSRSRYRLFSILAIEIVAYKATSSIFGMSYCCLSFLFVPSQLIFATSARRLWLPLHRPKGRKTPTRHCIWPPHSSAAKRMLQQLVASWLWWQTTLIAIGQDATWSPFCDLPVSPFSAFSLSGLRASQDNGWFTCVGCLYDQWHCWHRHRSYDSSWLAPRH